MYNKYIWTTLFLYLPCIAAASNRRIWGLPCLIMQWPHVWTSSNAWLLSNSTSISFSSFLQWLWLLHVHLVRSEPRLNLKLELQSFYASGINIPPSTFTTSISSLVAVADGRCILCSLRTFYKAGRVLSSQVGTMSWYNIPTFAISNSCIGCSYVHRVLMYERAYCSPSMCFIANSEIRKIDYQRTFDHLYQGDCSCNENGAITKNRFQWNVNTWTSKVSHYK